MQWNYCGNDFGVSFDYNIFNEAFSRYSSAGANSVRVWVHFDANKQLSLYDQSGMFKTLPTQFYNDIKGMLQLAKSKGLKVVLTMFSFECVNFDNCLWMMKDNAKSDSYINNGLVPLLNFISSNGLRDTVLAFESFNEPEWMIEGGSGVKRRTDLGSVQNFVRKFNSAVTSRGFQATVGSAGLKWTCGCGQWCAGNWWKNTGISFYTVHYYGWMAQSGNTFDPFNTRPSDWCITDKKVLIGESPGWTDASIKGQITVPHQFYLAQSHGWMGVMPWADKADTYRAKFSNIAAGLKCQTNWGSCKPAFALE
jgi:hypothetical protein